MKIQVMIVDDEPIAAQAIAYMIRKDFPQSDVAGICHSGRDAVRRASEIRPDIVIMDIQMPGINGLEAMRRIQLSQPMVSFLIVSAYSEFNYAVEALTMGAKDYLLKPVKQEVFRQSFSGILQTVTGEKAVMDQTLEQQERFEMILPLVREDFVRSLLPGAGADERLVACASFLGYRDTKALMIKISEDPSRLEGGIHFFMKQFSRDYRLEFMRDKMHVWIYVLCSSVRKEEEEPFERMLLNNLNELMEECMRRGYKLLAGVGHCYTEAIQVKQSAAEAQQALLELQQDKGRKKNVWATQIRAQYPLMPPIMPPPDGMDASSISSDIIRKADHYLKMNYMNEIALEDVASEVNLSPYYFSRFYKETAGLNYSEKLLRLRIEMAKEQLKKPGSSVKETAYSVGFRDPNYFSKVFKKETGLKASEFRAIFQKEGQE